MLRRRFGASVIALSLVTLVTHVGVSAASGEECGAATASPVDDATRAKATRAVLCLVNRERAAHRLRAVRPSRGLGAAARFHSDDMVQRRYFSHDGPAGDTPDMRVRAAGYAPARWRGVSEALAWGSPASPAVLMRALMQSPEHRRILLDSRARRVGVGLTVGAPADGIRRPSATLALVFGE